MKPLAIRLPSVRKLAVIQEKVFRLSSGLPKRILEFLELSKVKQE